MDPKTTGETETPNAQNSDSTPAATNQTPAAQQPTQEPQPTSPDVDPSDGKKWRDKFYGTQGRLQQVQAELQTKIGELEQQIQSLTDVGGQKDATITSLRQQLEQAQGQASTLEELQTQNQELTQQAAMAEKLKAAMQFPELLAVRVEEERETEDGEKVTEQVNPVLRLIESSNLDTDSLTATLRQMAAALPAGGQQQAPSSSMTLPSQPEPVDGDNLETLYAKAEELQERVNAGDPTVWDEHSEVWGKIKELEAAKTQ